MDISINVKVTLRRGDVVLRHEVTPSQFEPVPNDVERVSHFGFPAKSGAAGVDEKEALEVIRQLAGWVKARFLADVEQAVSKEGG